MGRKKLSGIIISISVLIIAASAVFMIVQKVFVWKSLSEVEACKGLFESSIRTVVLRKNVDSDQWASFEDEDLVEKWKSYLSNLKVKYARPILWFDWNTNGGGAVIEIKNEEMEYSFTIRENNGVTMLEIGNHCYYISDEIESIFTETYDAAIERHDVMTPWE